ncbi:hypothetical protein L227DRAFT_405182 [Lentinus tigrinus ALCF2SS1-6]|uniref:Uncharacterized protein n=1 Tax=Lentinus tigrinus ALCF2SS1-6 TaxID=1328759 RepID=A0A5C2RNH8_9APHY|nr:hypothetical protein L227DRAFT_405182 [Lentinus tigrinus ALCF2SS1-6]
MGYGEFDCSFSAHVCLIWCISTPIREAPRLLGRAGLPIKREPHGFGAEGPLRRSSMSSLSPRVNMGPEARANELPSQRKQATCHPDGLASSSDHVAPRYRTDPAHCSLPPHPHHPPSLFCCLGHRLDSINTPTLLQQSSPGHLLFPAAL